MARITEKRLAFAFDQLKAEDGREFELFVNEFLSLEIPGLRPVGGLHDGARDAYIYHAGDAESSFLQSSVTADWKRKITLTIAALKKNGNSVKELIYCTCHSIIADADDVRSKLRQQGVSLDIRDRGYFIALSNKNPERSQLCEGFAKKYVDPITAEYRVTEPSGVVLTTKEEQLALVYFEMKLHDKNSEMALTKFSFDSLIIHATKNSSPKHTMSAADICKQVSKVVPSHDPDRVRVLVEAATARLTAKGCLVRNGKTQEYSLDVKMRVSMNDNLIGFASDISNMTDDICQRVARVAAELDIDYEYSTDLMTKDVITLLSPRVRSLWHS